jgi:hypothetical protein
VFIRTTQCGVREVLCLKAASGLEAQKTGCRITELSVESDS